MLCPQPTVLVIFFLSLALNVYLVTCTIVKISHMLCLCFCTCRFDEPYMRQSHLPLLSERDLQVSAWAPPL